MFTNNTLNAASIYTDIPDPELCLKAQNGDRNAEEELVIRYTRLVRSCSRFYFLAGGDAEDLTQEGLMGLLKAVREYDPVFKASFKTYAEICIRSRLHTAIKAAQRSKHYPLNNYVPLESHFLSDYAHGMTQRFNESDLALDPERLVIGQETAAELSSVLDGLLSGFEAKILGLYLEGLQYNKIAAEVNRSPKSVDNAVQRIRRKLAQHLEQSDGS